MSDVSIQNYKQIKFNFGLEKSKTCNFLSSGLTQFHRVSVYALPPWAHRKQARGPQMSVCKVSAFHGDWSYLLFPCLVVPALPSVLDSWVAPRLLGLFNF